MSNAILVGGDVNSYGEDDNDNRSIFIVDDECEELNLSLPGIFTTNKTTAPPHHHLLVLTHRYHLNVFHIQLYPNIIVQYTIVRSFYQLHHHR